MEETERSLHDAIMIVRRTIKNDAVVAGKIYSNILFLGNICVLNCNFCLFFHKFSVKLTIICILILY